MIRVLNVITDSNIGGAGRTLLNFLRHYNRSEIDMTVLLPKNSLLVKSLDALGVKRLETDGLAEQSFNISVVNKLARLIKHVKPDIVHTHAALSARVAARLSGGCKVVYTRHSVFPNRKLLITPPFKQINGALNGCLADKIIAVSPAAKDNIVEAGVNPNKITVIFNGIDALPAISDASRLKIRESYGMGANHFVCGIFARLTPVKGHEYILRAADMLKKTEAVKIVIAGAGESEQRLKQIAADLRLDNVIFTGFVEKVEQLTAAMDVQLNASYGTEATSLSLLEGMSAGIPAVASSFGGNPYVIADGQNGFIVPEKDAGAIAGAITKLYNDKELYAKMSDNSRRIYNERFTAKMMADEIEKLYFSFK